MSARNKGHPSSKNIKKTLASSILKEKLLQIAWHTDAPNIMLHKVENKTKE